MPGIQGSRMNAQGLEMLAYLPLCPPFPGACSRFPTQTSSSWAVPMAALMHRSRPDILGCPKGTTGNIADTKYMLVKGPSVQPRANDEISNAGSGHKNPKENGMLPLLDKVNPPS